MANAILWQAPAAIATYLSTELNSLADQGNKLGAEIDNETNRDRFLSVELNVAAPASRTAGGFVSLWILYSLDGTNFSTGSDSIDPEFGAHLGNFGLPGDTTAHRAPVIHATIRPYKFKLLVINETGVAFAASGNTLKHRTFNEEIQS